VRLMAAGPGLAAAIRELGSLPPDAHERTVVEGILLRSYSRLLRKASRTPEEEEFIVSVLSTWKEARAEGRREGHAEGRAEEAARALLTVLRARGIAVSDAARERILAQKDPERLERWVEKAVVAASVDEVLDEPS
jgi:hypothetical protein